MIWKRRAICALMLSAACRNSLLHAQELQPHRGQEVSHELACGPFIGHVEPTRARVWARFATPGSYQLTLGGSECRVEATANRKHDLCVVWDLEQLNPGQEYSYAIRNEAGKVVAAGDDYRFKTAKSHAEDVDLRLLFGSCAREDAGTAAVWRQAATEQIDVALLLGDTPYIDSSELATQRKRYAEFSSVAEMSQLLRSTPWYGVWDDHDFGLGDGDGRLPGKKRSRQAFIEYHANPSYGENDRGIYTQFRRGPVEVFLLDTRYFAATEPSPFLKHHASLLGQAQWNWLRAGLEQSTAPVKVLACGMIWNAATRPKKLDHWGTYSYEREALFKFIGEKKISGVVLVGGDIHRSRVLRHDSKQLAGYDLYELISSPMHDGVIEAANAPHPRLIQDIGRPNMFMLLEVKQRRRKVTELQARFIDSAGKQHYQISLLE